MITEAIRSYEVSLWTLQDEFITVLKWSDVEHKGTIQDPKLTLADDGTENFTFTIPMYLYQNGNLVENPIWYNTRNGNLIANLRKVKVIFNKGLRDELIQKINTMDYDTAQLMACIIGHNIHNKRYFILDSVSGLYQMTEMAQLLFNEQGEIEKVIELVVTKVTEEHESDHLFCNVECAGLAFNELGKIGYTISLSAADFEYKYKQWQESDMSEPMPLQNVQFWCEDCLKLQRWPLNGLSGNIDPRKWYYDIQMSWPSFEDGPNRDSGKVYEESYVTNWVIGSEGELVPESTEHYREKERTVEANESNIYNITQNIAETFGIFCKYVYMHDNNYHIIARKIVFFNNYLQDENILSLTYPYSSSKVSREMDSTDTITKLYVKPIENDSTLLGYDDIRYCEANKMQEDYIFNFDYLKETKSITDEQYESIKAYEAEIYDYNTQMIPLENKVSIYENQITELKSKITYYTNAIAKAEEEINSNSDFILNLLNEHGKASGGQYIDSFDNLHPDSAMVLTDDSGAYYINLNTHKKGIQTDTVHIYRAYSNNTLSDEVTNFSFEYDSNNNPIRIRGVAPSDQSNRVYLTYWYEPKLYYDAIIDTLKEKMTGDTIYKNEAEDNLTLLTDETEGEDGYPLGLKPNAEKKLENLRKKKQATIEEFQYMMGPALREGNWTPENYQDYGERHSDQKIFSNMYVKNDIKTNTEEDFILAWDTKLFDTEQDIHYKLGLAETEQTYPCINLSSIPSNHHFWSHLNDYSFIFNIHYYNENADLSNIKNIRSFKIGSEAILGFVTYKNNDSATVFPVLILIGAKTMSTSGEGRLTGGTVGFMLDPDPNRGHPRLGIIETSVVNKNVQTNISNTGLIEITNENKNDFYLINGSQISMFQSVYPRIKFSSMMLKTKDENFFIHYNGRLLTNYEEYYILNRNIEEGTYAPEFYVTIKPEVFLSSGTLQNTINVGYTLSNAGTAIYLDALEIAKENAFPKVSYTVDPNILDRYMIAMLYNKLNWLVMINDAQLKLVNTFGYISKLELDLDFPDKDSIEIKNYKSKFEDLFSTIVASSESMKSNEGLLSSLAAGTYNISGASLANAVATNPTAIEQIIDKYIAQSSGMEEYMVDLFSSVGEIFTDASQTMVELESTTAANNKILNSFADKIKNEFSPALFRQTEAPTRFKAGDIWIQVDQQFNEIATYMATSNSSNSSGKGGWNRVHNGSLAQIVGTGMDADAVSGKVDITSLVYDDPSIPDFDDGGIFLRSYSVPVSSNEGLLSSQVIIRPKEINLQSATINLLSAVGDAVSALSLNGSTGIYLGSNVGIKLFSGNIYNQQGALNGANIELMPTHLLLGVTGSTSATGLKITPSSFIIASGNQNNITSTQAIASIEDSGLTGISTSLTGLKIADGFFGIATKDSQNKINAIIMKDTGLTLAYDLGGTGITDAGQADLTNATGSYVRLSGEGITISSGAKLNISASDLMIGTQNLNEYGNATFKMSDDAIWMGVKKYANGTNTDIKLTDTEVYLGATSNNVTSYASIQAGKIWLHVDQNNYVHIDNSGINMKGRDIIIGDKPIWSHNNIIKKETEPTAQEWGTYNDIIWVQPVTKGVITYSSRSGDIGTYENHGNYGERHVTAISSLNTGIPSGSSYYRYTLTITVDGANGANGEVSYAFTPIIRGANEEITFDSQSKSISNSRTDTITFFKDGVNKNLGYENLNIDVYVQDGNGFVHQVFRLLSATLNIEISSGQGRFPCNVYYLTKS